MAGQGGESLPVPPPIVDDEYSPSRLATGHAGNYDWEWDDDSDWSVNEA